MEQLQENSSKNNIVIIAVVSGILILDQVTKYIVKQTMYLHESIRVLGDFFRLTYIENPGMAFGIEWENKVLFSILSVSAAFIVMYYLYRMRNEHWSVRIALASIFGGAIGNLIDRFMYGRVVDFFDFEFFDISIPSFHIFSFQFPGYEMYRWPVFNIADIAVSVGMILIGWLIIFHGRSFEEQKITS